MSILADDLIVEILSRLPAKSVLRCRCVCKSWCVLISDPKFANLHFNRAIERQDFNLLFVGESADTVCAEPRARGTYGWIRFRSSCMVEDPKIYTKDFNSYEEAVEINYPVKGHLNPPFFDGSFSSMVMLGSCNGLICFSIGSDTFLWNPSTGEHKILPHTFCDYTGFASAYGFGYDPIGESYKLLRVVYFSVNDLNDSDGCYNSSVKVYSSGNNSWRRLSDIAYNISRYIVSGVFLNGALHWVGETKSSLIMSIVSFDIGDEVFREVPRPDDVCEDAILGVRKNCLCLLNKAHRTGEIGMYVMMEYGVRESWTKLFSIVQNTISHSFHQLRLLGFLNSGEILLQHDSMPVGFRTCGEFLLTSCKDLLVYDPKQNMVRNLKIDNIPNNVVIQRIETYVGTLMSLKPGDRVGSEEKGVRRLKHVKKGGKKNF